jgi:hypothetical protein
MSLGAACPSADRPLDRALQPASIGGYQGVVENGLRPPVGKATRQVGIRR